MSETLGEQQAVYTASQHGVPVYYDEDNPSPEAKVVQDRFAQPATWSAINLEPLPFEPYRTMEDNMGVAGVHSEWDQQWQRGTQYGIGLAIDTYRENLLAELQAHGTLFGMRVQLPHGKTTNGKYPSIYLMRHILTNLSQRWRETCSAAVCSPTTGSRPATPW
ncbi:hypothetical protein F4780DRAFT_408014 [Xylariomycetidae sp. FL0641]|nr:hypothetical protein F4780DRAFT_408014 [Xylariomycetidae sp. FL0641]